MTAAEDSALPTMEFDCESVRRLLAKVRARGGPGGTQRSGHRALPGCGPLPSPPISFFF